jgi:hypothetical protein
MTVLQDTRMKMRALKQFLKQPDDNVQWLTKLVIELPKEESTVLNLATACIRQIPDCSLGMGAAQVYMERYGKYPSVQKMFLAIMAKNKPGHAINALKKNIKSGKVIGTVFSNLRDIAVSSRKKLTLEDCNELLMLWEMQRGNSAARKTSETFFSVLVSHYPKKFIEAACRHVWTWENELLDYYKSSSRQPNEYEILSLQQPDIDKEHLLATIVDKLRETLTVKQCSQLILEMNTYKPPGNAVFVDGSNLYSNGKHFHEAMMKKIGTLFSAKNLVPVYVGHHYRTRGLNVDQQHCFAIPKHAKNCCDDLVWQYLALQHECWFCTKDAGRDHRYNFAGQFPLWYEMNWVRRSRDKNIVISLPPTVWPRAQVHNEVLYYPSKAKGPWFAVDL